MMPFEIAVKVKEEVHQAGGHDINIMKFDDTNFFLMFSIMDQRFTIQRAIDVREIVSRLKRIRVALEDLEKLCPSFALA